MQPWKKHQADLYLLANDILENFYYQPHGYKGGFYYAFNGHLGLLQSQGAYSDQLKLLDQLAALDALTYMIKVPPASLAKEYLGKNALEAPAGRLIYLKINPEAFNKIYAELEKYKSDEEGPTQHSSVSVRLALDDTKLVVRADQRPGQYTVGAVRYGGTPYMLFDYLITKSPNVPVTKTMLSAYAGINTSRNLAQLVTKILMPEVRNVFVPERTKDKVKLINPAIVPSSVLEAIITASKHGASQSIPD